MASTMAATRQPFGPVDSSRLQSLTSLKNRQNGMLLLCIALVSNPLSRPNSN
jgi:hypothetical protein